MESFYFRVSYEGWNRSFILKTVEIGVYNLILGFKRHLFYYSSNADFYNFKA